MLLVGYRKLGFLGGFRGGSWKCLGAWHGRGLVEDRDHERLCRIREREEFIYKGKHDRPCEKIEKRHRYRDIQLPTNSPNKTPFLTANLISKNRMPGITKPKRLISLSLFAFHFSHRNLWVIAMTHLLLIERLRNSRNLDIS